MTDATLVIGNYNYSSWSLRAWLMATWSGLDFEVVRLPLDTQEFAVEIPDWSPTLQVPVLHIDGMVVWESLAIGECLAERFPNSNLWPEEGAARVRARCLAAEMHAGFHALCLAMPMNCRAEGRSVSASPALLADIERIKGAWDEALNRSGGPCLFGAPGIVDAMYAPVTYRFATYGVGLPAALQGYVDYLQSLPALQQWYERALAEPEVIEAEEVGR